jgi:hypothetical protein
MINIQELRIGNWVGHQDTDYNDDGETIHFKDVVSELDKRCATLYSKITGTEMRLSYDSLIPIPLTQELMDKLEGWERLPQVNGPIVYRKKVSPVGKYLVVSVGGEIVTVLEEYLEAMGQPVGNRHMILLPFHAKALHQLQNLYFALTGTELELNL